LLPDVTVLLDLDPAIGRERLDAENKRFDRLESEALEFHTRVRDSYLELAAAEPDRFIVVDATLDRDVIRDAIRARLNERS
jgi:dTMP kinase